MFYEFSDIDLSKDSGRRIQGVREIKFYTLIPSGLFRVPKEA
jgi:hypothetical protein